jgi:hypothetical protein
MREAITGISFRRRSTAGTVARWKPSNGGAASVDGRGGRAAERRTTVDRPRQAGDEARQGESKTKSPR